MTLGNQRASQGYGGLNGVSQVLGLNDLLKQVYKPPGQQETDALFQDFLDALNVVEKKVERKVHTVDVGNVPIEAVKEKWKKINVEGMPTLPISTEKVNLAGTDFKDISVTYDNKFVYINVHNNDYYTSTREIPDNYVFLSAVYKDGLLTLNFQRSVSNDKPKIMPLIKG